MVKQDLVRTLRFDKIAGSNFEHQRCVLMARRADYRDVIRNPCLSANNKWAFSGPFVMGGETGSGSDHGIRHVPGAARSRSFQHLLEMWPERRPAVLNLDSQW